MIVWFTLLVIYISRVWRWNAPAWRAAETMSIAPVTKFSYFGIAIAFEKFSVKFSAFSVELVKGYDFRNKDVSRNGLLSC